jgi:N utilization substance protein B
MVIRYRYEQIQATVKVRRNNMSRRTARKHIFNLIFQQEYHPEESLSELIVKYKEEYEDYDSKDNAFIFSQCKGIIENKEVLDKAITEAAVGWTADRMAKTDLSLLRLATYEILFVDDIPDTVSINEALELSKNFCDEKGTKFINGVLGKVLSNKNKQA